jgi:hypothetical protein
MMLQHCNAILIEWASCSALSQLGVRCNEGLHYLTIFRLGELFVTILMHIV